MGGLPQRLATEQHVGPSRKVPVDEFSTVKQPLFQTVEFSLKGTVKLIVSVGAGLFVEDGPCCKWRARRAFSQQRLR